MKRFYTKLLLLVLCATATLPSLAYDCYVAGIYYNLDKAAGTATVTYYSMSLIPNEYTGNVVIPSTFNYDGITYSVTSIGYYAFHDCKGLKSITIPNSVKSIGSEAFSGCTGLTSPVYNANVFAFLPTSYRGDYAIPEGIHIIAGGAFSGCTGLTSITIPNSVTSIGSWAFRDCTGLTSITIPNSVKSIGDYAFSDCI